MSQLIVDIAYQCLRVYDPNRLVILMIDNYSTATSVTTVCNHCKNNLAEIFQESGNYCLYCWQEITCPNV
jgi:hypothetical protein